jgi:hypothetical protein
VKVDVSRFGDEPGTSEIAKAILLIDLSDEARSAIEAGLRAQADPQAKTRQTQAVPKPLVIAGLMLGSPDFQRR